MRWWIPLAAIGGLVVIVIVVGIVLLSVQDVSAYRDLITEKVSEQTGRKLAINGDFDLSISFSPAIVAEDVTFENAEWGSRPEMLTLKRLEAEVALFPMLGGTVKIKRLVLVDGDLLAETDANVRGNWEFEDDTDEDSAAEGGRAGAESGDGDLAESDHDDDADDAGALPSIEDVQIENLKLTYLDGQTGETRTVGVAHADGKGDGEALTLQADGELDGEAFTASVDVGSGSSDVPVSVLAEIAGGRFTADGVIGDRDDMSGLNLDVTAKGSSLDELNRLGVGGLPDIGAYDIAMRLTGGDDQYRVENLVAKLGGSDITGSAAWASGDGRSAVVADLTSGVLNLDELLKQPAGKSGTVGESSGGDTAADSTGAESAAGGDGSERIFSDDLLPVGQLREMDAQVSLKAREVRRSGITLSDMQVNVAIENGRLIVSPLDAGLGGGTLAGEVMLDASRRTPQVTADISILGVDLAALGIAPEVSEIIEGPLDLTVDIAGSGGTLHAIASNLDGRV